MWVMEAFLPLTPTPAFASRNTSILLSRFAGTIPLLLIRCFGMFALPCTTVPSLFDALFFVVPSRPPTCSVASLRVLLRYLDIYQDISIALLSLLTFPFFFILSNLLSRV